MKPLADQYTVLFESPDPEQLYAFSPGIVVLPGGKIVATIDLGGKGVAALEGPKGSRNGYITQGKVFVSNDGGQSWRHRADFPYMHARPFTVGSTLYVLGQCQDIMIIRSDDQGETWSEPVKLTEGGDWHQAPCNVLYANDCIYLVMEHIEPHDGKSWPVVYMCPVLMRGRLDADLTEPSSWTYASRLPAYEAFPSERLDYFGVPFLTELPQRPGGKPNHCARIGWLETNVVQFTDPDHYWYDPEGKTFHLWARSHTGGVGYAAIAKVKEHADGTMTTMTETVPSGKQAVLVPCPGGQMKFHLLYDETTRLYWLLSSQTTDSMTRHELLPLERHGLPNNERHRLQLHFSKNCIDWCFAGLVAVGASPKQSRHYASMAIYQNDLYVLSRSADSRAKNSHDNNLITLHIVRDFRSLVY